MKHDFTNLPIDIEFEIYLDRDCIPCVHRVYYGNFDATDKYHAIIGECFTAERTKLMPFINWLEEYLGYKPSGG